MNIEIDTPVKEKEVTNLSEWLAKGYKEYEPSGEVTVIISFEEGDPVKNTEEYQAFQKALSALMDKAHDLYEDGKKKPL